MVIYGNPALPNTILTITHELGHLNDSWQEKNRESIREALREMDAFYPDAFWPGVGFKQAEVILRAERNSWAFVLSVLKPFINKSDSVFPKNAVLDEIHYALRAYSKELKSALGHIGKMVIEKAQSIKTKKAA